MVFTCPLLFWCRISSPFRENNNVVVFQFHFHILMPLAHLWFIRLQGQFPNLRTRSCSNLHPLIHPPGRENPYPGIHSVPTYVRRLWRCSLSLARRCRWGFFLHWGWDPKAFLMPPGTFRDSMWLFRKWSLSHSITKITFLRSFLHKFQSSHCQ